MMLAGLLCFGVALWPYQIPVTVFGYTRNVFSVGVLGFLFLGCFYLLYRHSWSSAVNPGVGILLFVGMHAVSTFLTCHPESTANLMELVFYVLIYALCLVLIHSALLKKIVLILVGVTAVLALVLFYQHFLVFGSSYLTQHFSMKAFSSTGYANKNQYALFLVLFFPFAYAYGLQKKSILFGACAVVFSVAIIVVLSRMALYLWFLAMILFCVFSDKRKLYFGALGSVVVVISIVCLVFGWTPSNYLEWKRMAIQDLDREPIKSMSWTGITNSEASRVKFLREAWEGVKHRPILGAGFRSFPVMNVVYYSDGSIMRFPEAHNDYATLAFEHGLLGVIIFLNILFMTTKILMGVRKKYLNRDDFWLWEAQIVSFSILCFAMLFVNIYVTVLFWFVLASCHVVAKPGGAEGIKKI